MEYEFTLWRIMLTLMPIPAQYAKFITSLIGLLILYIQMYGPVWHLTPAMICIGAALGVYGVPNRQKGNQ